MAAAGPGRAPSAAAAAAAAEPRRGHTVAAYRSAAGQEGSGTAGPVIPFRPGGQSPAAVLKALAVSQLPVLHHGTQKPAGIGRCRHALTEGSSLEVGIVWKECNS